MVDYNEDLIETFDNKPDEITERKIEIDANFSTEDLLAIIAEIDIDNHELIKEIRNSNEIEGIAFNSAEIDDIVVVIIGKKLLECTAKLSIEAYEKVTFITIKDESRIYVVPVKTNVGLKNSSNIIINPATEDKQDDIISKQDELISKDFATENTLSSLATENGNIADIKTNTNSFTTINTPMPVTLTTADTAYLIPASELSDRRTVIIYNKSDTDIYYGASDVTTTNGILLPAGGNVSLDIVSGLYAVCGVSGKIVNVLELK